MRPWHPLLLGLPACGALLGLDADYETVTCLGAACGAPAADAATPPDAPSADAADVGPPSPGAPLVVPTFALPAGTLDFDLDGEEAVVLAAGPSRVERCGAAGCTAFATLMPPEDARRTNTSLAVVPLQGTSRVVVAQRGQDACSAGCDGDVETSPGVYEVLAEGTRRLAPAMPLGIAKSRRASEGWLVGGGTTHALAQASNNEGPTTALLTVFTFGMGAFGFSAVRTELSRGTAVQSAPVAPFVYAATETARGAGGYAGLKGAIADVKDSARRLAFEPRLAAVTGGPPVAAHVVATNDDTPDDAALTFPNTGDPLVAATKRFPGLSHRDLALAATDDFVVRLSQGNADAGLRVVAAACRTKALLEDLCVPLSAELPFDTVLRTRAAGATLWILGALASVPALVRVTFR